MNKVTLQGVTIGTAVAAVTALFTILFHKNMPVEMVALLPVIIGALAHYLGVTFAQNRALKKALKSTSVTTE